MHIFGNKWKTDSTVSRLCQLFIVFVWIAKINLKKIKWNNFQCPEVPPVSNPCKSDDLRAEAEAACRPIIDPNDSFGLCSKMVCLIFFPTFTHKIYIYSNLLMWLKINTKTFYEQCMRDYCYVAATPRQKSEALCHAFSALATECSENFVTVEWRKSDRCRKLAFIYFLFYCNNSFERKKNISSKCSIKI